MDVCKSGEPELDMAETCRNNHLQNVKRAEDYTDKFNIGRIITEFGSCYNTKNCYNEISSLADAADQKLVSWAYW